MASTPSTKTFHDLRAQARKYCDTAQWELAENALRDAMAYCDQRGFPNADHHKLDISVELAEVTRRHNKYDEAVEAHLQALESPYIDRIKKIAVKGELGVNYRHLSRFGDAQETLQEQYDLARLLALDMEAEACRAAGNLGITKFQLYEQNGSGPDKTLLYEAIRLLNERVDKAASLQSRLEHFPERSLLKKKLRLWESIGLSRLSIVYAANGEIEKAIEYGRKTVEDTEHSPDPTVRAVSRFILGNALQKGGFMEEARQNYNYTRSGGPGETTPAIALCKESSDEHRRYLKQMIDADVDLTAYDEQGYSALDYAVYSNDEKSIELLSNGLTQRVGIKAVIELKNQAVLRKQYREVLHSSFRPILSGGKKGAVQNLRKKYIDLLRVNEEKRRSFDYLRLVSYEDFRSHGRLPSFRERNGMTRKFIDMVQDNPKFNPYVVFFSYRWIGPTNESGKRCPDDAANTQYLRMLQALEKLLEGSDSAEAENLYIWLDCACIDQGDSDDSEDGRRERGINALPIFLAQCNSMISLVDDEYFERAWCAVEVLLMQTLRTNYTAQVFDWHEHVHGGLDDGRKKRIEPSQKKLTYEDDRPAIRFLERQSMLLAKVGVEAKENV